LTKHARTLADLAGELREALDLAGGVNLTGDAYGQTAARFATAIEQLARLGQEMLRDGVDALESTGTTIRETAAAYERDDSAGADRLAGIGGELG
jgi:hypothetical protein